MKTTALRWFQRRGWAVLVAACYLLFLDAGLNEPDEGRYAEIGREMAVPGGDWFTPHLNGFPHFQKPPFLYWCTALSLKVFGAHEWSARLPATFAAFGTLALTAWIGQMLMGRGLHRTVVLVLASSIGFFGMAHLLTPDMMLTFWVTAAIACAVRRQFGGDAKWGWLFFVAMGFGFMTKGPMALVVPLSAVICMRRTVAPANRAPLPWVFGLLLTLAVGLWWFIALSVLHRKLFEYFAGYELVQRFTSGTHGRTKPAWFFIVVLPIAFLPWSAWLPSLAHDLWKRWRQRPTIGPRAALLCAWAGIPFLVLSFSGSKLPTYVLPLLPPLALGVVASCRARRERRTMLHRMAAGALALGVTAAFLRDDADTVLAQQADTRDLADIVLAQPDFATSALFASQVRAQGFTFATQRLLAVTEDEADIVLKPTPAERERLFKSETALEKAMSVVPSYGIARSNDIGPVFAADRWTVLGQEGDFVLIASKHTQALPPAGIAPVVVRKRRH